MISLILDIGAKLMVILLEHLNETIQALTHLPAAMVPDDEGHLEFGMVLQVEELPGMEVGDEKPVFLQCATHHPVVQSFRQVMQ